jgi:hypothetical protein
MHSLFRYMMLSRLVWRYYGDGRSDGDLALPGTAKVYVIPLAGSAEQMLDF